MEAAKTVIMVMGNSDCGAGLWCVRVVVRGTVATRSGIGSGCVGGDGAKVFVCGYGGAWVDWVVMEG